MNGYIPVRTCAGCGRKRPKSEMIRVLRTPEKALRVDTGQRQNGRSVYLCPQAACLQSAEKRKSLERGLRMPIPPEIREQLQKEIESCAAG